MRSSNKCRNPLCVVLVWLTSLLPSTGAAQCEQPTDSAFFSQTAVIDQAVEAGDFEQVLAAVDGLIGEYDYAVLLFSRARALHRLERWADAEAAYTEFLRHYTSCEDPDQLAAAAREHRLTVIERQRLAVIDGLANEPVEPAPDEGQAFNPAWVPVIAGGAVLIAAVAHEITYSDIEDEQRAADRAGDTDRFFGLKDDWEAARVRAFALWGSGAALVAGGVLWLLLDDDDPADVTPAVGWDPRGGARVVLGGRF